MEKDFPTNYLTPNNDTRVLSFLNKYPEFDGRNTIIAILDGGVDPSAPGLQKTSDSKPKILDLIDITGEGDCDISTECLIDSEGYITGLTGHKLKIPENWTNPSRKFYCGMKPLYQLCDCDLRERLIDERKKKLWTPFINQKLLDIQTKLDKLADYKDKTNENETSVDELVIEPDKEENDILEKQNINQAEENSQVNENKNVENEPIKQFDQAQNESKLEDENNKNDNKDSEILIPELKDDALTKENNDKVISDTANELTSKEKMENTDSITIKKFLDNLHKEDLKEQMEIFTDSEHLKYDEKDVGPIYDVIVWNDGTTWQSCIDTTESGDLIKCKVLTNYKESYEYGTFDSMSMLNYTVRILPDEKIIQIVTNDGTHGTHVAGIACSYYPNSPELNGIAPGAQIISIKMTKLNDFNLLNACRFILDYKCDLVNYSMGPNLGKFCQSLNLFFANDLIKNYGVILCASAGNDGPCIQSALGPSCYGSSVISVGAYAQQEAMKTHSSLIDNSDSMLYTWSSRGPNLDGSLGVDVCAPGGAFSNVSSDSLKSLKFCEGTSMSSPYCCGCIALVLSGLIFNKIDHSPFGVKRAIENTSLKVDELLGAGSGLIQVEALFDYLKSYKEEIYQSIHFEIKFKNDSKTFRGIYLLNENDVLTIKEYLIQIVPIFYENKFKTDNAKPQRDKINFYKKLKLVCVDKWVECPAQLVLVNEVKDLKIRIRADELEEGKCHFTQVIAYDLEDCKMNSIFKIPITVVKPFVFETNKKEIHDYQIEFNKVSFKMGQIERYFIRVPFGATNAEIKLKIDNKGNKNYSPQFSLQALILGPEWSNLKIDELLCKTNKENIFDIKVESNRILQLVVAKKHDSFGESILCYSVRFNGLFIKHSNEVLCFSSEPFLLQVESYLRNQEFTISSYFDYHCRSLMPFEYKIKAVKKNYGTILNPVFQICLSFKFNQSETGSISFYLPKINYGPYDNEYQSVEIMLFDSKSKRLIKVCQAFYMNDLNLPKGDYRVHLVVRHDKIPQLEKLKESILYVQHELEDKDEIKQDIYLNHIEALKSGTTADLEYIEENNKLKFYLNPIQKINLPSKIENGDFLSGYLCFYDAGKFLDHYKILYFVNNYNSISDATDETDEPTADDKSEDNFEKLNNELRDVKVSWISKIDEQFEKVSDEYQDHVPVYLNRIKFLKSKISNRKDEIDKLDSWNQIIELSRKAINKIDENSLLQYFGQKQHDFVEDKLKKEFEEQKEWIIDLLCALGSAINERNVISKSDDKTEMFLVYKSIMKWSDLSDEKISDILVKFYVNQQFYGKALKILFNKITEATNNEESDRLILEIFKKMDLEFLAKFYENTLIMTYRKQFEEL